MSVLLLEIFTQIGWTKHRPLNKPDVNRCALSSISHDLMPRSRDAGGHFNGSHALHRQQSIAVSLGTYFHDL
jgi:hypothetical protein